MIEEALIPLGWWLVLALAASLLGALMYPLVRRVIRGATPRMRSCVRFCYACMAPLAAAATLALGSKASLGAVFVPNHCHDDVCALHTPVYAVDSLALLGLSAAGSLIVLLLAASVIWALRRSGRRLRALQTFARNTREGYRLLSSKQFIACCAGLWRPEVLLSSSLVKTLRNEELQIVLAHEYAHAQRLDNLRALLIQWATLAWPPSPGRQLREDANADAEQACDREAVRAGFAAASVAATIHRLARTTAVDCHKVGRPASAFGCDSTSGRLDALSSGSEASARYDWLVGGLCLAVAWGVQVSVLSAFYHGAIEWLGGALL
ncbi:MAG: hypothetical protein Hals2KO_39010 [Halioglobus sp.]